MSGQTRCPNCGGYRVWDEVKKLTVSKRSGKTVSGGAVFGVILLSGVFLVLALAIMNSQPAYHKDPPAIVWILFAPEGITLFGGLFYLLAIWRVVKLHRYTCSLCGYKWAWRADEPEPEATQPANPDLIARGEQNLRNAAAAAAWEQQRRQHNH